MRCNIPRALDSPERGSIAETTPIEGLNEALLLHMQPRRKHKLGGDCEHSSFVPYLYTLNLECDSEI
jgi:hypothetical protein